MAYRRSSRWSRAGSAAPRPKGWRGCVLGAYQAAAGEALGALVGTVEADTWLTGLSRAGTMVALHGEAVDASSFPSGDWPSPNSATFGDATVTDGDADWSLAPR